MKILIVGLLLIAITACGSTTEWFDFSSSAVSEAECNAVNKKTGSWGPKADAVDKMDQTYREGVSKSVCLAVKKNFTGEYRCSSDKKIQVKCN